MTKLLGFALDSVVVDATYGCRLFQGRVSPEGYAFAGRQLAHKAAWEAAMGSVPEGYELDHACRRRNCIALHHLEPVTRSENEKRKKWRYRAKLTHCKLGHAMDVNAIVTPEGGRVCRACNREAESHV